MNASYNVNDVSASTFIIWTLSAVDSTPKPFLWKFHVKISLFPSSICLCRFYITIFIVSYPYHSFKQSKPNRTLCTKWQYSDAYSTLKFNGINLTSSTGFHYDLMKIGKRLTFLGHPVNQSVVQTITKISVVYKTTCTRIHDNTIVLKELYFFILIRFPKLHPVA